MANKTRLGIIIGNRDFFPDSLVETARNEVIELCQTLNITPIVLDGATTKLGGVETYQKPKNVQTCSNNTQRTSSGFGWFCPTLVMKKG